MAQCQGDLQLAGFFADQGSGRLELFFNNQWGTICINGFTRESADTACRQLGRSRALSFGEADELGYVFDIRKYTACRVLIVRGGTIRKLNNLVKLICAFSLCSLLTKLRVCQNNL